MVSIPRAALTLIVLGWLGSLAPAPAAAPEVQDQAHFFSAGAVQEATAAVQEIQRLYRTEVVVESFLTVPNKTDQVKDMSTAERERFFRAWVQERAQETGNNGIEILICRQPGHVEVGFSEALKKRQAFSDSDRNAVSKLLLEKFQNHEYDTGLRDALKMIRERLAEHVPAANEVQDRARFFLPDAVQRAGASLRAFHQQFRIDVMVETFATPPASRAQAVEAMSKNERNRFFQSWAEHRLIAATGEGVEILIVRHPGHLQVEAGPQTAKKAFTTSDARRLRELLVSRFEAKEYDEGLNAAIDDIRQTVEKNLGTVATKPSPSAPPASAAAPPPPPPVKAEQPKTAAMPSSTAKAELPPSSSPPTSSAGVKEKLTELKGKANALGQRDVTFKAIWILWIVLGLIGLWIVIGVLRALFHPRRQEWYGPPMQAQSPPSQTAPPPPSGGRPVQPGYSSAPQPPVPPGGYTMGGKPYYGAPPPATQWGGGAGRGFLGGMLGGMLGGAAANWVHDSFSRRSGPTVGGGGWGSSQPSTPTYGASPPASPSDQAAAGGFASSGGDFDDSAGSADPAVASSGGDFGAQDSTAGSGGDFDQPAQEVADPGTDFGNDATPAAPSTNGDFGDDSAAPADGGDGDFGGDAGGGGFGADAGGGDAGGGDFRSGDSA